MSKLSKLSVKQLFAVALRTPLDDPDSNDSWAAVHELRTRATPKIYRKARKLCRSKNVNKRQVGVVILAQFGHRIGHYPLRKQRIRFLLKILEAETDPVILYSLAVAFGHLYSPRANPALLRLKNHPDAQVRYGVAFGLYTYDNENPDPVAVLIELSADSDSHVRDWATFRLHGLDFDSEAIREALYARLNDPDDNARGEAMHGLAKRNDQRVFEPLLAELEGRSDHYLMLDAAKALADTRLLPALRSLLADSIWLSRDYDDSIREAIHACETGVRY